MILLDPRQGSGELLPLFSPYGVQVVEEKLEVPGVSLGDMAFYGHGEDGRVSVGIERKRLSDMVGSMRTKRVNWQLDGLCQNYDYVWIVLEGIWGVGSEGEIVVPRRGGMRPFVHTGRTVLYRELMGFLTTMKLKCGTETGNHVRVEKTGTPQETVAFVVGLYRWFEKPWRQHRSHEAVYGGREAGQGGGRGKGGRARFHRREVPFVEHVAGRIPGIGTGAKEIGEAFGSVKEMVEAGVEDWREIEFSQFGKTGKVRKVRMGKARAEKIVGLLRGEG